MEIQKLLPPTHPNSIYDLLFKPQSKDQQSVDEQVTGKSLIFSCHSVSSSVGVISMLPHRTIISWSAFLEGN